MIPIFPLDVYFVTALSWPFGPCFAFRWISHHASWLSAPCTMHLCVFAIQETLANHLYGTLYHNAPCSYLPSRYRKFTFYYDFLWISDHDTKCTMHHAPCTMHLCVFANKETLANELHGTLYVDAPYTYFYLKIDFLLWFSMDFWSRYAFIC